jgi:hypothetical protein
MFKIVRHYLRGGKRTVRKGLTLHDAQAHCSDPETASHTCEKAKGVQRTRRLGPWFDGYYQMN